jgi:hypothetical protein
MTNTQHTEQRALNADELDKLTRYDHRGCLMAPDQTGDYFLVPDVRNLLAQARATLPDAQQAAVGVELPPPLPSDDELRAMWRLANAAGTAAWGQSDCDTTRHVWQMRKIYQAISAAIAADRAQYAGAAAPSDTAIWTAITRLERSGSTREECLRAADDLRAQLAATPQAQGATFQVAGTQESADGPIVLATETIDARNAEIAERRTRRARRAAGIDPVIDRLLAAYHTAEPIQATRGVSAEQIAAGAAVLGDDGKPIGRNTAIMVADAMRLPAAVGAQAMLLAQEGEQPAAAVNADGLPGDWSLEWDVYSPPGTIRLSSPKWGGAFVGEPKPGDIVFHAIIYRLLAEMLADRTAAKGADSQGGAA